MKKQRMPKGSKYNPRKRQSASFSARGSEFDHPSHLERRSSQGFLAANSSGTSKLTQSIIGLLFGVLLTYLVLRLSTSHERVGKHVPENWHAAINAQTDRHVLSERIDLSTSTQNSRDGNAHRVERLLPEDTGNTEKVASKLQVASQQPMARQSKIGPLPSKEAAKPDTEKVAAKASKAIGNLKTSAAKDNSKGLNGEVVQKPQASELQLASRTAAEVVLEEGIQSIQTSIIPKAKSSLGRKAGPAAIATPAATPKKIQPKQDSVNGSAATHDLHAVGDQQAQVAVAKTEKERQEQAVEAAQNGTTAALQDNSQPGRSNPDAMLDIFLADTTEVAESNGIIDPHSADQRDDFDSQALEEEKRQEELRAGEKLLKDQKEAEERLKVKEAAEEKLKEEEEKQQRVARKAKEEVDLQFKMGREAEAKARDEERQIQGAAKKMKHRQSSDKQRRHGAADTGKAAEAKQVEDLKRLAAILETEAEREQTTSPRRNSTAQSGVKATEAKKLEDLEHLAAQINREAEVDEEQHISVEDSRVDVGVEEAEAKKLDDLKVLAGQVTADSATEKEQSSADGNSRSHEQLGSEDKVVTSRHDHSQGLHARDGTRESRHRHSGASPHHSFDIEEELRAEAQARTEIPELATHDSFWSSEVDYAEHKVQGEISAAAQQEFLRMQEALMPELRKEIEQANAEAAARLSQS